ncbi:MAG TPA: hypothetical protein VGC42_09635, partial [Kofleriaceae bacterium]
MAVLIYHGAAGRALLADGPEQLRLRHRDGAPALLGAPRPAMRIAALRAQRLLRAQLPGQRLPQRRQIAELRALHM